jgi:hypothetical protein
MPIAGQVAILKGEGGGTLMKGKKIARTGATLLTLLAIPAAAAAQAPGIVPGANGGAAEVVFAGGCVVTYDAEGRRMGLTACSNDQLMAAHEAYASHLREEAEVEASAAADDRIPPQIIAGANREAEVVFSGNCVVHYDAEGRRVRGRSTCSSEQLAEADAAQTAYREEQGWDDPEADAMAEDVPAGAAEDAAVEGDIPEVVIDGNGKSRVVFRGGCTVSYDDRGRRTGQTRPCDATQVGSADEAMATYRQVSGS